MKLDDLCATFQSLAFPRLGERAHPERQAVLDARAQVFTAVADDEFLADCIDRELRLIEEGRLRRGLSPFFTLPELGIHFTFGYWSPGMTPGPHEHTAWTITAVCRNWLEVLTYNREESYRRRGLVPKNRFEAPAGKVGYIYDPCIHEPRNTSDEWSLSLHIVSPRDGERPADQPEPLPVLQSASGVPVAGDAHPFTSVLIARQRERYLRLLTRILLKMHVAAAPALLARCFGLASSATRRLIQRSARVPVEGVQPDSTWRLARTHRDLVLTHRHRDNHVALDVETPNGPRQAFVSGASAREAVGLITREVIIDVDVLPGSLTAEERAAIGEALEQTGLFTRVRGEG
ncbi:uncharacterized protein SOCE26_002960 [Sorangium cellulosum]|uniref:Uncharacterized protein n=1 Tax=Sorangium cellulosum TaxID=56 RepID=A0A2L0EI10_SORCE|nr:hypothetical protein [Sorangium cellulosum]AUX38915.1 uncharacterized protein SOCE26_002960 [Sorangium cellulosum]